MNNVKPYIDLNFRTKSHRNFTGIAGSSLGGLFSFYAGLKHQHVFSKIGVFSPSFWFSEEIYRFALDTDRLYDDIKLYFVGGALENVNLVPNMIRMVDQLRYKGYTKIKYLVELDGVHQEWFWNREFPKAYEYLYLN